MAKENKSIGRKKLTPQEKQARETFLKNETQEARTKRVLNPRMKKLLSQFDSMINAVKSNRYTFTNDQQEKILSAFADRYNSLEQAFKGSTKKEIEDLI